MASRRPPSQRNPEYAVHRLGTMLSQILPGAHVKNAAPVKATPSRPAPPGAGALLGYAEVSIEFPASLASDALLLPTSVSIDTTWGQPALSAAGADMTYADGDRPGLYVTNAVFEPQYDLNQTLTDVHMFQLREPILGAPASCLIGDAHGYAISMTGQYRLTSATTATAEMNILCTGGTDRQYSLVGDVVKLYISRFAAS